MGLKVHSSEYKITFSVSVPGEKRGNFTTDDIVSHSVIRNPILKPCPISILTADIDHKFILSIDAAVRSNEFPDANVTIEWADDSVDDGSNARKGTTRYFTNINDYKIIKVTDQRPPTDKTMLGRVTFVMIEPLFYWLAHSKGFNTTLIDKTAMEAIELYEGYLFSEYGGGGTFDPVKHILGEPSEFIYRKMQIKSANDLIIPNNIIYQYKPLMTTSYYFLDSFRSLGEAHKRILRLFVELDSADKFESFDVTQNGNEDMAQGYIIDEQNFGDRTDRFKQYGDYGYTIMDNKGRYKKYEPTEKVSVPKYISNPGKAYHNTPHQGGRGGPNYRFHPIGTGTSKHEKPPKEALIIYSPDNIDMGKPRYEAVKTQIRDSIHGTATYSFPEIQPNSIEFQRKYNLDIYAPGDFKHVCIGICNQFKKINMKEARYNHTAIAKFMIFA
jgi:hypothetical protein